MQQNLSRICYEKYYNHAHFCLKNRIFTRQFQFYRKINVPFVIILLRHGGFLMKKGGISSKNAMYKHYISWQNKIHTLKKQVKHPFYSSAYSGKLQTVYGYSGKTKREYTISSDTQT